MEAQAELDDVCKRTARRMTKKLRLAFLYIGLYVGSRGTDQVIESKWATDRIWRMR